MKIFSVIILATFSISAKAQVGIGTTSPSEAFDIETSDASKTGMDINNTSTGDPLIHFQVSGTTIFTMGVDNDDSDKFKIGTTALETNTAITINASQQVAIGHAFPSATLDVDGSAIFNESGSAVDVRIEGDTDPNLFFVDGSADMIGVSTNTPSATLDVAGSATFNKGNDNADFKVEGQTDGAMIFVDASADMVGISTSSPTSMLDIQGGMGLKVNTITSATTLDNTHNVVFCNTGAYTVTLPTAGSVAGKTYYIKNIDTGSDDITIATNGAETIDGEASLVLYVYNDAIRIVSDGTNWRIVADERIPHKCVLTRDAVQTISNTTNTEILFDAEGVDNAEMGLSDGTNGNSITIQRAGEYIVTADWTSQDTDANEYTRTYINVNGVAARVNQSRNVTANSLCTSTVTYTATFAAGDYIDMWIQHNEGANMDTEAAADEQPRLTVVEVR